MSRWFRQHPALLYGLLLAVLLLLALFSLSLGELSLSLAQIGLGITSPSEGLEQVVIREIRLPRVLLAMLAGAALGMSGAALQGYLRNPLADPALLGVTQGAAFAAVLALTLNLLGGAVFLLPVFALFGAIFTVRVTCLLAGTGAPPQQLILAGIAMSSLMGAGCALALNLAPNPFAAMEAMFWLMGSLEGRSLSDVAALLPFLVLGIVFLLSCCRGLNALTLGEETAASLGISLSRLQWRLVAGVSLAVGAVTAFCGSIGFIGLVVPHLLRPLTGHMPSRLLPASALGGAALVLLADSVVRLIPVAGMELRLGVVTALIGAPFFLYLLLVSRGRG